MTERLKELLANEKDYIDLLKKAIGIYKNYGLKSLEDESLLSMPSDLQNGKFEKLFVNIEDLFEFHQKTVLPFIEKSIEVPIILFSLFSGHKMQFFNLYGPYCSSRNKFLSTFVAHVDYFEKVNHLTGCGVSLDRIFSAPIHAISKYKLLIADAENEFRKKEQHLDNADILAKALMEIDDVFSYCEEIVDIAYIINFEVK